jgi:hypothetical protein
MNTTRACVAALAIALAAVACDTVDPTTSSTAPSVVVPPTTENFTGTVLVKGSDVKSFNVLLTGGTLAATLTAAGPPSTISMNFGVGTMSGSTCTLLGSTITSASSNPQLADAVNAGSYCIMVSDSGSGAQTAPVTYSVVVTHY